MTQISLYDQASIDSLVWPETAEAQKAKNFMLPLIKEGVNHFIKNVHTDLKILRVDDIILPLTINEKEYRNSYVTSFYSIVGILDEKIASFKSGLVPFLKLGVKAFGLFLRFIKINKAVTVNNWLFATGTHPQLTSMQVKHLTIFLQKTFPDHMVVFRSVNSYSDGVLLEGLKEQGYQLISTREVFFFDPKLHKVWSKRDCKRDLRLLKESCYKVHSIEDLTLEDLHRGLDLYYSLYVEKYTRYSPQFTSHFIELLWKNQFLEVYGLKKEGKLDGITGFFKLYETMIIPFFGYDTTQPVENGLYRMVNILGLQEAHQTQRIFNQGSGASDFKRVRGLVTYREYFAIATKHLTGYRKIFWKACEFFTKYLLRPFIK